MNFKPELCCLFGKPVAENPTQAMIEAAFRHHGLDWRYVQFEVEPEGLADAVRGFRAMGFRGGNVTTPHKVAIVKHLDRIAESASLMGAVNCIHAVVPQMIERGSGQLVGISSLAGIRGLPKSAAYSASKAGMTAFFESVRLDTLGKGIDVTIIQPGFIETPLTSGRTNKMPYLMKLDDAIPHFIDAIERKKKFAAFPWQLATIVRLGKIFPASLYDRIASRMRYRE